MRQSVHVFIFALGILLASCTTSPSTPSSTLTQITTPSDTATATSPPTLTPTITLTPTPSMTPIPPTPEYGAALRYDPQDRVLYNPADTPVFALDENGGWVVVIPAEALAEAETLGLSEDDLEKFELSYVDGGWMINGDFDGDGQADQLPINIDLLRTNKETTPSTVGIVSNNTVEWINIGQGWTELNMSAAVNPNSYSQVENLPQLETEIDEANITSMSELIYEAFSLFPVEPLTGEDTFITTNYNVFGFCDKIMFTKLDQANYNLDGVVQMRLMGKDSVVFQVRVKDDNKDQRVLVVMPVDLNGGAEQRFNQLKNNQVFLSLATNSGYDGQKIETGDSKVNQYFEWAREVILAQKADGEGHLPVIWKVSQSGSEHKLWPRPVKELIPIFAISN